VKQALMRDISGAILNDSWKIRTIQSEEWLACHQSSWLRSGKACRHNRRKRPEHTPPDVAMVTMTIMECLITWTWLLALLCRFCHFPASDLFC
jgi:hypothetical protein